ncbi:MULTISPECIES: glycosyltransferase [Streptococcus]|uniref:glycosyltransferase n=1 Tax=Streptococcus TaxID=1301 RepID=UPI000888D204|nr:MULTISPECIES: glycosyltransferase [Streptococcus]SDJ67306.1 Glycosyltransferase involved in cell wall bisynthesis [Streptococcus gallolyticus]SDL17039.1 Glycosyltransferase involved in cell wall bisynthesis [Streptococcus gallolyticus]
MKKLSLDSNIEVVNDVVEAQNISNRPKVLMIGAENFGRGGRSVIAWNLTESLVKDYQVDFLSKIKVKDSTYFDKIKERHARIIIEPYKKNKLSKFLMRFFILTKYLRKEKYVIAHINADDAWEATKGILLAKLSGINRYVVHAHNTKSKYQNRFGKILISLSKKYLRKLFYLERIACSKVAATFLFGSDDNVRIIENGISLKDYKFSEATRIKMREKLRLSEHAKVVGTVGRLSEQKNPLFILKIVEELVNMDESYQFVWIGDGPLKNELVNKAKEKGVLDHIKFLGNRSDVKDLLQAYDVFILPSLYEGFGIVNIEAQASGLPCLVSDAVPELAKVNSNFYFLSINENAKSWAQQIENILNYRILLKDMESFEKRGFDIKQGAEKLRTIYEKVLFK